jgi:hypothetical protein
LNEYGAAIFTPSCDVAAVVMSTVYWVLAWSSDPGVHVALVSPAFHCHVPLIVGVADVAFSAVPRCMSTFHSKTMVVFTGTFVAASGGFVERTTGAALPLVPVVKLKRYSLPRFWPACDFAAVETVTAYLVEAAKTPLGVHTTREAEGQENVPVIAGLAEIAPCVALAFIVALKLMSTVEFLMTSVAPSVGTVPVTYGALLPPLPLTSTTACPPRF